MTDPIKPKYIDAPIKRRIFNNEPVGTKGINVLDSDYDKYINPSNIDAINISRGQQQPWYTQLGNNTVKLIPAIGLGILENAGYIGELFDKNQDYTNALTEWATKGRQKLDEALPVYRQNPNETFDLSDSGWWAQNGMGLVESVGEFFVTGAAVGGLAGSAAKGIANLVKAGKTLETGLLAAGQLGTASTLAYTEGAMSGAQVYKDVYTHEMQIHGNIEAATQRAAKAASETVRLNTILNTGLNITSVTPIFKTMNTMRSAIKLGLNRQSGEKLAEWATRIGKLESVGAAKHSAKNELLREAIQEGIEEDINLYAEGEGRITGGLKKASSQDSFERFLDSTFTKEGALNAILGAVGGVGQTIATNHIPYKTDPTTGKKISNSALNTLQESEAAKGLVADLKADIGYITTKQKELNSAVEKGDKEGVNKAKEDLFNIGILKAIRNGTSSEFADEIRSYGQVDNVKVGEDGKTEAMRQGYADSTEDNTYRETALQKANDIKALSTEYENLTRRFGDKFTTDQVFRSRLNVYSAQENINKLDKEFETLSTELNKSITIPELSGIIHDSAGISAVNSLINTLQERTNLSPTETKMLGNLKSTKMIAEHLMTETLQSDSSLKAKLTENVGVIKMLTQNLIPIIAYKEELKQLKADYNKLVDDKDTTIKIYKPVKEEILKELVKQDTEKKIDEEADQEAKDKDEALGNKEIKKQQYREVVGDFAIISNPKTKQFDVVDEEAQTILSSHPTVELAKAAAQDLNKKAKEETKGEPQEEIPIIINTKSSQEDSTQQVKTKEDKDKEEQIEEEAVKENTINENVVGKSNKIAYRAREGTGNAGTINQDYLILHSPVFGVGSKVTLRIATESPYYKPDHGNNKVAIGVYYNDVQVGFVHVLGDNEKNPQLAQIRDYVVANGPIETTITDKDLGVVNRGVKSTTSENLPQVITYVIAKDDGKIYTKVGKPYHSEKLVNKKFLSGRIYAIVTTPNDKEFAIALDTKRLTSDIVDSIMIATNMFLNPQNISETDNIMLDEVFEKFDIDVRTPDGYEKYFKTFLFNYNLTKPDDIATKNADKNDKRWVNFSGNGVRFMRSGGAIKVKDNLQAKEVGKNTPVEAQDGLLTELHNHISKMFFHMDLEALQDNAKLSVPIFKGEGDNIVYTEYSKKNYKEYIASNTETNAVQFKIGEDQYSTFISPKIYFNTSFLGKEEQENNGKAPKKSKEKATLSAEPKTTKKFKSMTKRLANNKVDPQQVTKDTVEERKKFCE